MQVLQQADVRCLEAAADFAGLPGPAELVRAGLSQVRATRALLRRYSSSCGGGGGGGGSQTSAGWRGSLEEEWLAMAGCRRRTRGVQRGGWMCGSLHSEQFVAQPLHHPIHHASLLTTRFPLPRNRRPLL